MSEIDDAELLFSKGFNWAQALLAAYGVKLGMEHELALKLANPFGGGLGKTGGTCGAVTGALMIIGLKYGTSDAADEKANAAVYEMGRKFMQKFKSRNTTTVCRDLLGFDVYTREKMVSDEERVIFDLCPKYIQDAAEIIDELMNLPADETNI